MTTEELEQIRKLLEAEREQTKRIVREEIEAEEKTTRRENSMGWIEISNKVDGIENRLKDVEISNGRLEQGQAHTNTALDAVTAGIEDVQEQMATREDVKRLESGQEEIKVKLQDTDAKYYKKVREYGQRIDELEKLEGLPNPTKH